MPTARPPTLYDWCCAWFHWTERSGENVLLMPALQFDFHAASDERERGVMRFVTFKGSIVFVRSEYQ